MKETPGSAATKALIMPMMGNSHGDVNATTRGGRAKLVEHLAVKPGYGAR